MHRLVHPFADAFAIFRVGVRQQQNELLPAISGSEVVGSPGFPGENLRDRAQAGVAGLVAVLIILEPRVGDIRIGRNN
jgi:hypothetical protein